MMQENITPAGIIITQTTTSESILVVVEIIFFIVTGLVAVITYLSARKTVLQPIKTEVFKQQLIVFSDIMKIFNGKSELELRGYFDINSVVEINTVLLINDYCKLFFGKTSKDVEALRANCPSSLFSKTYAEKYFSLPSYGLEEEENRVVMEKSKEEQWKEMEAGEIVLTKEYVQAIYKINLLISSPLLPKKCIEYLKKILVINDENTSCLYEFFEEIAQIISQNFTTEESIYENDFFWIHNRYNDIIKDYENSVKDLLDYISKYLKVEELLI